MKRKKILSDMNFHAFDSFEGLPELSAKDKLSEDFSKGQYLSSIQIVKDLAKKHGMPLAKIQFHEGWFSKTCTKSYAEKNL